MDDSQFPLLTVEIVEKTLTVVQAETDKMYRLEAVRCLNGTELMNYGVRYYVRNDAGAWVKYLHFPHINRDSADSALNEALQFVNDRPQYGEG